MKKIISVFLCAVLSISFFIFDTRAAETQATGPVIDFVLTSDVDAFVVDDTQTRATGLILIYGLEISRNGTTLKIVGKTLGAADVVRSGFKNLTVERRKNSSSSWEDYYEYGNVYVDAFAANLSTSLTVESGYQYRVTTKHYAKKSLLVTQTISNASNIIQF